MNMPLANKIGKSTLFFISMIMSSMSVHAQLTLRATSLDGAPITTVHAGEPCFIEVVTTSASGRIAKPTIEGLSAFTLRAQKSTTQYINGHVTTAYAYQVYNDTPGTYTLGPATVELPNGDVLSSNEIKLSVVTASLHNKNKSSAASSAQPLIVRATLDKQHAFVGEKIVCTLACMLTDKAGIIAQIEEPKPQGFRVTNPRESRVTEIDTDGQHYYVHEWQWDLYPEKAGDLTVPAFRVQAQVPYVDQRNVLSLFGHTPMQRLRTYSNACTVAVDALPRTNSTPAATLGVIHEYTAHVTPAVARQGEGMTLTLAVVGDCAWHMLPVPELQGVPPALKVYPSRSFDQQSDGQSKKCFEYIVQALDAGTWQIPAQTCTYFDTSSKTYKTVSTAPLTVTVVKDAASTHATVVPEVMPANSTAVQEQVPTDMHDGIYAGLYDARIDRPEQIIPWDIFVWLLVAPLVCAVCWYVSGSVYGFYYRSAGARKQAAFAHARKKMADVVQSRDYTQLHSLFMQLCTDYYGSDKAAINQNMIDAWIEKARFSEREKEEWQIFYARIMAYSFADRTVQHEDAGLIKSARQWLELLQERL